MKVDRRGLWVVYVHYGTSLLHFRLGIASRVASVLSSFRQAYKNRRAHACTLHFCLYIAGCTVLTAIHVPTSHVL
jgi:ABC-type antimicrobial peptide transport system permease subunit